MRYSHFLGSSTERITLYDNNNNIIWIKLHFSSHYYVFKMKRLLTEKPLYATYKTPKYKQRYCNFTSINSKTAAWNIPFKRVLNAYMNVEWSYIYLENQHTLSKCNVYNLKVWCIVVVSVVLQCRALHVVLKLVDRWR